MVNLNSQFTIRFDWNALRSWKLEHLHNYERHPQVIIIDQMCCVLLFQHFFFFIKHKQVIVSCCFRPQPKLEMKVFLLRLLLHKKNERLKTHTRNPLITFLYANFWNCADIFVFCFIFFKIYCQYSLVYCQLTTLNGYVFVFIIILL